MTGRRILISSARWIVGGLHLEVEIDGTIARPVHLDDRGEVLCSWWGREETPADVREACRLYLATAEDQTAVGRELVATLAERIPSLRTRLEMVRDGTRLLARVYLGSGAHAYAYRTGGRWRLTSAVPPRWRPYLARAIDGLDVSHGLGGAVANPRSLRDRKRP